MAISQSIDAAREERIGPHGVSADALKAAMARAEDALEWVRARHADRSLPLLRLPETHGDLETIKDTARRLADEATDIVILGTGGSSLGGQMLAQLAGFAVPGVGALRTVLARCSQGCRMRQRVLLQSRNPAGPPKP